MKKIIAGITMVSLLGLGGLALAQTEGGIEMQGEIAAEIAITVEVLLDEVPVVPAAIDWGSFALSAKLSTVQDTEAHFPAGYTSLALNGPPLTNHYHPTVGTAATNNTNVNLSIIGTDASNDGVAWELSDAAGANAFALAATAGHSAAWLTTPIADEAYVPIAGEGQNLVAGASMVLDFKADFPTSSTKVGVPYLFGITVLATAI